MNDEAMDLAKRLAFELFSKWDIPRPQTEEMILAEITPLLAANEQQVANLCADRHIREAAKRVLPAAQVDGDSVCVPPIEDVVDAVVQQVSELWMDVANYRGACAACGTKNCDMLTDDTCVECERLKLEQQVAELREKCARYAEKGVSYGTELCELSIELGQSPVSSEPPAAFIREKVAELRADADIRREGIRQIMVIAEKRYIGEGFYPQNMTAIFEGCQRLMADQQSTPRNPNRRISATTVCEVNQELRTS